MLNSSRIRKCVALLSAVFTVPALAGNIGNAADPHALFADFQRPAQIPDSKTNPMTPEKAALGQMLFFDPRLSGSGTISCASCHNPALGWGDGLAIGYGNLGSRMTRHTPTLIDVAFGEPYFWDGRAETLEDQAKGPLMASKEMDMTVEQALARLKSIPGYVDAFNRAFPGREISLDSIADAIAAYERTIVSKVAPFDRWLAGDETAISASAKRGFALYNGKANCAACHSGWRMTDDGFHDIGLAGSDLGRAAIAPGIPQLEHAFKTPTLRNINQRAPYMHDGSVATLAAVIDHYDHGFLHRSSLDTQMHPLHLIPAEKEDLVAFLNTLTSVDQPAVVPVLPQ